MKKIIFIFLSLVSLSAFAEDYHWLMGGTKYSSLPSLCEVYGPTTYGVGVVVDYVTYSNGGASGTCTFKHPSNASWSATSGAFSRSGSGCTSPNIYDSAANSCVTPPAPECTAGKTYATTLYAGSATPVVPTSSGGCSITIKEVVRCYSNPNSADPTKRYCELVVTETGAVAPSGTEPAVTAPAADAKSESAPPFNPAQGQGCPSGTVSLGIDSTGGSICGGFGTSPTAPTKTEVKEPATTVTNPDGSTDRVDISHRTNSDGSITTTTKTTTTGADGKVTVKEVPVTGPKPAAAGGGAGVSDAKDEDKTDLCKLHPELNVCKNSEVTGGACSGGVDSTACTGDAIQCAILRQQKKEYCEWNKENPSATLGNQAVAGNDPLKSTLPTKENASQFNMQSLDQSGFLGGGSCFQDKSVTVQGIAINLPFSKLCPYLEWLRYVIMIIAALVSLRIVSKPVLGD